MKLVVLFFLFSSAKNAWSGGNQFWWGISTSSYQTEDVAIASQDPFFFKTDWDLFYEQGKLPEPKGNAVFGYTQYKRDIQVMKKLGVTHYRFGLEWARIEPHPGQYNEQALKHYLEVVHYARANGIEPILCLWHFTFPSWAFEKDQPSEYGWLSPIVTARWVPYVQKVMEVFGSSVEFYAPQNEPNAHSLASFFLGIFPPGEKRNLKLYKRHVAMAADRFIEAASVIHKARPTAQVLSVQNIVYWEKAWWDIFSFFFDLGSEFNFDHLDRIKDSIDILGFNYYYQVKASPFPNERIVSPKGLRVMANELSSRYKKPMVITENGWPEKPGISKKDYFLSHWKVVEEIRKSADIRGYFYWSLVDNFEWSVGYKEKFGMFSFNQDDQTLHAYPVADAFKDVIAKDKAAAITNK